MADKPQDMTVVVTVMVSGTVDSDNKMTCTATYAMASCVPPAPAGSVVVASNGDIDLNNMEPQTGFTEGTDIYFMLQGTVTGPNGDVPVFFQTPAAKAVTITVPKGRVSGIKPHLPGTHNATMLMLDDLDVAGDRYDYTLHIVAFSGSSPTPAIGELDPAIVDRGGGFT